MATYSSEEILERFMVKEAVVPYRSMADDEIDYSDIPELTEAELRGMKRLRPGRPPLGALPRKMISLKIDPFLLARLKVRAKGEGMPYQSLIHRLLEEAMVPGAGLEPARGD